MSLLTPEDIMNAACLRIGETPLQSFDDETPQGQAATLVYEEVVDFNLGIYLFSFSRKIAQLSVNDGAVPLSGWTYVFDLPPERIGPPQYVTDDITDPDRRFDRYSLVEATVHTDANPVFAMIRFRPDPQLWSAAFRSATITALAARLAMTQASDRNTADMLTREAYGTVSEAYRGGQMGAAIRDDSYATPPRPQNRDNNPLTRAMSGGAGSYSSYCGPKW